MPLVSWLNDSLFAVSREWGQGFSFEHRVMYAKISEWGDNVAADKKQYGTPLAAKLLASLLL